MPITPFEGGLKAFNGGCLCLINLVLHTGQKGFMSSAFILFHSQPVHWSHHEPHAFGILLINYK